MSRLSRTTSEKIPDITEGDHDVVSRAVHAARVPLCQEAHPDRPSLACTRAAGHTEADRTPARKHVAAGIGWIALLVWLS